MAIAVHHAPTRGGAALGKGSAKNSELCRALQLATAGALAEADLSRAEIADARFTIDFPGRKFTVIERQGRGRELTHGLPAVRRLTRELVAERLAAGKEYLLRAQNRQRGGVHKYYYATEDRFEDRLYTIYTASWVYTMLEMYAAEPDERIPQRIAHAARFILSMQSEERGQPSYGGFYYSYDLERGAPDHKLVVGTASKTIFTLLELSRIPGQKHFLDNATRAADWLLTMQRKNGDVKPYIRLRGGRWVFSNKSSLLYTGQVLSALSRIYAVTGDGRYGDAAHLTSRYLLDRVARGGCYLGDDYRKPNPVSSSWLILSLFDYARATGDQRAEETAYRCADELLTRQIANRRDVYRHGRWRGSLSSSGNGWLAEVMSELHGHCRERGMANCQRFEASIIKSMRLLAQYAYTEDSAFVAKNPRAALGGVFWNARERHVRTDSVCHSMNAFINIFDSLDDGVLIELPERPLADEGEAQKAAVAP